MVSVAEAEALIAQAWAGGGTERVPLTEAAGRVLAQEVVADRAQPPFDRVAMDGVALKVGPAGGNGEEYAITGLQAAGQPAQSWAGPGTGLEVMTGALLPLGCDTVVPYEDLTLEKGRMRPLPGKPVLPGKNIHFTGEDYASGDLLLTPGTVLLAPHIHVLATVGLDRVLVRSRARLALAATGDELVGVSSQPLPHQIRRSNTLAIAAEARAWGLPLPVDRHLPDEPEALKAGLATLLGQCDVLVLSGGVSMGKFDLVPATLEALGCTPVFHKVRQKPGKPLWFGRGPQGQLVFGLPGNPVSSLFSFRRYVLPGLLAREGRGLADAPAAVQGLKAGRPGATHFLPVGRQADGTLAVLPVRGSGNFFQLAQSAGFVQLDEDFSPEAGTAVRFFPWGRPGGNL